MARRRDKCSDRRRTSAAILLAALSRQRKVELRLARVLEEPFLRILDAARSAASILESVEAFLRRVNAAVEKERGDMRDAVRRSGSASASQGYAGTVKELRRLGVEAGERPVPERIITNLHRELDDETYRSLDALPDRLLRATEFLLSKKPLRPFAKKLARVLAKAASTYAEVMGEFAANEDQGTGWWEWYNRGDERVRGSHRDKPVGVGKEVRRVGVLFSNGCRYPRDPLAPIGEIAGCRCGTKPVLPPTGGSSGGGVGSSGGGSGGRGEDPEELIEQAFNGEDLTDEQVQAIREYVADRGFNPRARALDRDIENFKRLGIEHVPGQRYSSEYLHHIRHVRGERGSEWPEGTTPEGYSRSVAEVVRDPETAIYMSTYKGRRQLTFFRRSKGLRGPAGHEWVMVEYGVGFKHWITAFQPSMGLEQLDKEEREKIGWLREPT